MADAARQIGDESSQGLRDVCSGRKRASAELVAKLAAVGVDVLYVLTGEHARLANEVAEQSGVYAANRREQALLDNYRHAPEEGRDAIERTALALAKSAAGEKSA